MLSVGLSASAIADVTRVRSVGRSRNFAVLICSICIVGATIVYTVNIVALTFDIPVSREAVAVVSLFPYAFSVLVSAGCIVAVEGTGRRA